MDEARGGAMRDGYFVAPDSYTADGFVLRCYRPGDGERLAAATGASYEHLAPWMPWAEAAPAVVECERRAREFRARWLLCEDFVIAVVDPDDRELWGGCGYHLRAGDLTARNAEIGMWIHAGKAGEGLGTRVLRALLDWGFGEAWPWLRLSWRCDTRNTASRRVAEKAGLALEGISRSDDLAVDGVRRDTCNYAAVRDVQ